MSPWETLAPAVLFWPALTALVATSAATAVWRPAGPWRGRMIRALALWCGIVLLCCAVAPRDWLRPSVREADNGLVQDCDTAIVFGFGYCRDPAGRMVPGAANHALLDWVVGHAKARTLLVQEGIWVAACKAGAETCCLGDRRLVRMHAHDPCLYVDTNEAAVCVLSQMWQLGKTRALVVSHDLQQRRAAFALRRAAGGDSRWRGIEFVVPSLPRIPFVGCGWPQPHTASAWLYKPVELLWARPRDSLGQTPECRRPVAPGPDRCS